MLKLFRSERTGKPLEGKHILYKAVEPPQNPHRIKQRGDAVPASTVPAQHQKGPRRGVTGQAGSPCPCHSLASSESDSADLLCPASLHEQRESAPGHCPPTRNACPEREQSRAAEATRTHRYVWLRPPPLVEVHAAQGPH